MCARGAILFSWETIMFVRLNLGAQVQRNSHRNVFRWLNREEYTS
jgi:hypothetical protein